MTYEISDIDELILRDGGKFIVNSRDDAYAYCKKIALGHYENFPVGSVLIPKRLRKHFFSIYAFSRLADDISDEYFIEHGDEKQAIAALESMEALLTDKYFEAAQSGNPVFIALRQTMKEMNLPDEPFLKLIEAFKRDVRFILPSTYADLEDYCVYSANPVGELVLRLFGLYNNVTAPLSDKICTGLQLANFMQDVSADIEKKRIYIPSELYGTGLIFDDNVSKLKENNNLQNILNDFYGYSFSKLDEGAELIKHLPFLRLRLEIAITIWGGKKILFKSKRLRNDIVNKRPKLGISDLIYVFVKSVFNWKVVSGWK